MSFKKVIIAVDLDPVALGTLSQLKGMSLLRDSDVQLVHVFEQSSLRFDLIPLPSLSREDSFLLEKVVVEKLEALKKDLGLPQARVKFLLSENARQEFLQYAEVESADLLIAASQEKEGLRGFFEGSFTSFLNKFARANVLVLRPQR
jgi:nucleotide-binding universal stress UspA family protein